MLQRFSLRTKLLAGFGTMAALVAIVAGTNLYFQETVYEENYDVTDRVLPDVLELFTMRVAVMRVSRILPQAAVNMAAGRSDPSLKSSYVKSKQEFQAAADRYQKIENFPGEAEIFARVDSSVKDLWPVADRMLGVSAGGQAETFAAFTKEYDEVYTPAYDKVQAAMKDLLAFQEHTAAVNRAEAAHASKEGKEVAVALALFGVLLALIIGFHVARSLSRSLAAIVDRVAAGSAEVAAAAQQIAGSSTELSESAAEQAAAIQETASSIDELNAMTKKNADNAARSRTSSAESREVATAGNRRVEAMVQSMDAIADANARIMQQVEEGNREIAAIVNVINDISTKTKVINDIVFQTKLLSFNASVEAARAGEHGKGFAVVAEEVGNLAQMSGNAAKEITDMLDASVKKVEGIVSRTKESVAVLIEEAKRTVDGGGVVARECGEALEKVLATVGSVDQLVSEIAHASGEQATGINEITNAMNQLDQATNQNTIVAQSCAAASEQLSAQAKSMDGLVSELNALLRGVGNEGMVSTGRPVAPRVDVVPPVAQVIPFRAGPAPAAKKAAGGELPSSADPRFEDV